MSSLEQTDGNRHPEGRKRAFTDRRDAGKQLARLLRAYQAPSTVVLALPRGGVPVAYEVARSLNAPLYAFPARKIGAPAQPELGIGAVAAGGTLILNEQIIREMSISQEELAVSSARAVAELQASIASYWGEGGGPDLAGRSVILVDDGLATGGTALAALQALRKQGVEHLILAVPVCAAQTARFLSETADDIVCVLHTENLSAVGLWYENFDQTPDEEVVELLEAANRPRDNDTS